MIGVTEGDIRILNYSSHSNDSRNIVTAVAQVLCSCGSISRKTWKFTQGFWRHRRLIHGQFPNHSSRKTQTMKIPILPKSLLDLFMLSVLHVQYGCRQIPAACDGSFKS